MVRGKGFLQGNHYGSLRSSPLCQKVLTQGRSGHEIQHGLQREHHEVLLLGLQQVSVLAILLVMLLATLGNCLHRTAVLQVEAELQHHP